MKLGKELAVGLGMLVWLAVIAQAYLILLRYEGLNEPAETAEKWPELSKIQRSPGRYTLLMFLHPKCPCSFASLNELSKILSKTAAKIDARIYFLNFPGDDPAENSRLWMRAARIPGLSLHQDLKNEESRIFGAISSGYTLLYNPDGTLVFAGGITAGRGHEGDNRGALLIEELSKGRSNCKQDSYANKNFCTKNSCAKTPVFGCSFADNPSPNGVLAKCIR